MTDDTNPVETREWLDALDEVVKYEGAERASFLLLELAKHAKQSRLRLPSAITTPFSNTIPPEEEKTSLSNPTHRCTSQNPSTICPVESVEKKNDADVASRSVIVADPAEAVNAFGTTEAKFRFAARGAARSNWN